MINHRMVEAKVAWDTTLSNLVKNNQTMVLLQATVIIKKVWLELVQAQKAIYLLNQEDHDSRQTKAF